MIERKTCVLNFFNYYSEFHSFYIFGPYFPDKISISYSTTYWLGEFAQPQKCHLR